MVLSFDQKRKIFNSFPIHEYTTHNGNRTNFKYKNKVVVSGLIHTGNGYIWGKDISKHTDKYIIDERGWINFKRFSEDEIRTLLTEVLSYQDKLVK
ncbi:hypothetical protein [Bacillus toyonensis]|uniref:hypothetical protein n=1 Tax=Bacillus toyonensis TaxID=155322 RepID=UPI000BFBAD51|nr:hypothetical protein [Bacillus toyonensis]PHD95398.1 hypothetical protein COF55_00165 [Bacillus toyonensis]QQN86680.1 hypothetical protein I0K03_27745 [Bacillus toyonensis]